MPTLVDTIFLVILQRNGDTIRLFSNIYNKPDALKGASPRLGALGETKAGGNSFLWNMRYPDAEKFDGMVLWSYDLTGPKAVPGTYQVRLSAAGKTETQSFEIVPDPRSPAKTQDFAQQFEFVQSVEAKLTEMHQAIREIRNVRAQIKSITADIPKGDQYKPITSLASRIDTIMTSVEEAMYQTKNRSPQDPLNFPVRLNDKFANLMGLNVGGDFPPTQQAFEVRAYLFGLADEQLLKWKSLKDNDLPELNRLVRNSGIDLIRVKK